MATMDSEHAGQLSLLNDLKAAIRNEADDGLIYTLLNELVAQNRSSEGGRKLDHIALRYIYF